MTWNRAAALGGVVLAVIMLATVRDYGVTWDEPDHRDYGRAILDYYRSGCVRVPPMPDLNLYGGVFDTAVALVEPVSPWGPWTTRHLATLCLGLLGVAGAWRTGTRLGGPAAGFWAGLLLAVTPAWYGHSFNNPQDLPFATGYIWSLVLMMEFVEALPAPAWSALLRLGVVMGLTWGVRIGGVLLAGYFVAAAAVRLRGGVWRRDVAGRIAVVIGLAYLVMLTGWPAAQHDPVAWPASALAEFTRFTRLNFGVMFGGQVLAATAIPWTYVPTYLGLTLPEPFLLLLIAGPVWWAWFRGRADRVVAGRCGLVAAAVAVPVGFVILRGSVLFNAIRHLLFLLPPLAALAGTVLAGILVPVAERGRAARLGAGLVVILWGAWHTTRLARLHPYEFLSYNALGGGLHGAFQRYDLDYWGESYPEAIRFVQRMAPPRPGVIWRIAACGAPRALEAQIPRGFVFMADPTNTDFLVGMFGVGCGSGPGVPFAYVVRDGVPLAYACDLRPASRVAAGWPPPSR